MNILIVLTSHNTLGNTGQKTGFWLEELAAPYYSFIEAGAHLTLASPAGGEPPLDPKSDEADFQTKDTARFKADPEACTALANTVRLGDMQAQDFDAVFYPGGHGPLWDLANDPDSIALIQAFWRQTKPVSLVCHAPGVLKGVTDDAGLPLVQGKRVTGFSNTEEAAVGLSEVVPFLLEDELKALGATYEKTADWQPLSVTDGLLVTGQNPASSTLVAQAVIRLLSPA